MQLQSQVGKLPEVKYMNDEIALNFSERETKKHLFLSIDHVSGSPDANVIHCVATKRVIEILKQYRSFYGVPEAMRTDPKTVFLSDELSYFGKRAIARK